MNENITFGLEGVSDEEIQMAARITGAEEFINKLPQGYETLVGENGRLLSGGERQKIVLARAFVRRPQLLILDEPTTGLDKKTIEEFLNVIKDLRDRGMTVLYITHEHTHLHHFDRIIEFFADHHVEERTNQSS